MSLMHHHSVVNAGGRQQTAVLADSLNIQRMPAARAQLLARELHRVAVDGVWYQVEKAFIYLDLPRGQAFLVQPPRERVRHAQASALLQRMLATLTPAMRERAHQVRLVFGIEELREKVVAAEAGIDDRAVELMKAALLHDHPVLMGRPRLRLSLDAVDAAGAQFLAAYDHSPKAYRLTYANPQALLDDEAALRQWAGAQDRHNLYALAARGDPWVSYRRWLPAQDAQAELHRVVAQLQAGQAPAARSAAFGRMLKQLPRGSALSGQAKQDLRRLFDWARACGLQKLQDQLFELRFGLALDDDWYRNDDPNDIDSLWQLLRNLPDAHVEGNSQLAEINLGADGGGTYSPSSREIEIGVDELDHPRRFEGTLRHEVGHAVHENQATLIDAWLWKTFGWAEFETSAAGVADWAARMGPASGWTGLTDAEKAQVRSWLKQACGPTERWGPSSTPQAAANSVWRRAGFGPRLAFEHCPQEWWKQHARWYRANGHAFALNYWYGTLMCVRETTLEFIAQGMPDSYAAMSPKEFFAELYAVFYDLQEPHRARLPKPILQWMQQHLGAPEDGQAEQPPKPPAAALKGVGRKTAPRGK